MSRKLVVMLALCVFSVQASDRSIETACQQLILRLALPKIGGKAGSKSSRARFSVRVIKKSQDLNNDLVSIELQSLRTKNKIEKISLKAKESRDRKERDYKATWQHANMREGRPAAQARENFYVMNALYDQLPAEQQQHGALYYKETTMLLPISVGEHKHDANQGVFNSDGKQVKNTRKRRLDFEVEKKIDA